MQNMARYGLFVVKVPLNPNQANNQPQGTHRDGWSLQLVYNIYYSFGYTCME